MLSRAGPSRGGPSDVIRGCASRREPSRERPRRRDRSVGAEHTNKQTRESEREARAIECCSGRADERQQRPSLDRTFAIFGRALYKPKPKIPGGQAHLRRERAQSKCVQGHQRGQTTEQLSAADNTRQSSRSTQIEATQALKNQRQGKYSTQRTNIPANK